MTTIEINKTDKSSTIRLKQKTKIMLGQLSNGKETYEETILKLIKLANNLNLKTSTQLLKKGNIIGTKYETTHKTLHLKLDGKGYVVVCKYNDLSILSLMRNKSLKSILNSKNLDWRLELELVNIDAGSGWKDPKKFSVKELNLIYFVCVQQILEELFNITFYQFSTILDYFNIDNWIEAYNKYDLSKDSLQFDIRRKLV